MPNKAGRWLGGGDVDAPLTAAAGMNALLLWATGNFCGKIGKLTADALASRRASKKNPPYEDVGKSCTYYAACQGGRAGLKPDRQVYNRESVLPDCCVLSMKKLVSQGSTNFNN